MNRNRINHSLLEGQTLTSIHHGNHHSRISHQLLVVQLQTNNGSRLDIPTIIRSSARSRIHTNTMSPQEQTLEVAIEEVVVAMVGVTVVATLGLAAAAVEPRLTSMKVVMVLDTMEVMHPIG